MSDPMDIAAHAVAHVECPDCGDVIPLTLGEPVIDEDGDLTVDIRTDDVWAHSWTHDCGEEDE